MGRRKERGGAKREGSIDISRCLRLLSRRMGMLGSLLRWRLSLLDWGLYGMLAFQTRDLFMCVYGVWGYMSWMV